MEIIMLLLGIGFMAVNIFFIYYVNKKKKEKQELESWRLKQYTDPDMISSLINDSGVIFGAKDGATIARTEDMKSKEGHVLVVGGSGSGKTSCIAIPTLLAWNERVFAIDIKGELYEKTKHQRPNIKVFNPTDENAFGYDPYIFLQKSTNPAQEARAIAQALIPLPPNIDNPFWIEMAQNILTGAFLHYYESHSFIETLKEIQSQSPLDLIKTVSGSHNEKARLHVMNFAGNTMNDTISGIFAELGKVIITLVADNDIISALSRKKVISPTDLEYGQDIYIHIPEYLLDQWKNLLGLMLNQFLTFFEKRDEATATPILFLLDEFPRLGKIEKIKNGLGTLRSRKITICLIIQSLAQIDSIYGETDRKVICDNCTYKAVLSATDKDSQEYFSKLVGTWEKPKISINKGKTSAFMSLGSISDGTTTTTEKTDIIKPEEFATLKEIILLTPFPTEYTPSGFFRVDKQPYYLSKIEYVPQLNRGYEKTKVEKVEFEEKFTNEQPQSTQNLSSKKPEFPIIVLSILINIIVCIYLSWSWRDFVSTSISFAPILFAGSAGFFTIKYREKKRVALIRVLLIIAGILNILAMIMFDPVDFMFSEPFNAFCGFSHIFSGLLNFIAAVVIKSDKKIKKPSKLPFIVRISSIALAVVAIGLLILGVIWKDFEMFLFTAVTFLISALCYVAGFISKVKSKATTNIYQKDKMIAKIMISCLLLLSVVSFIPYIEHCYSIERQKLNDDISWKLNVVGDRVYYNNFDDDNKIYSIKTDGTGRLKLTDDTSYIITVADDKIYYRNSDDGNKIYSIKTDGTNRQKLNDDSSLYINVVDDRIYYINDTDGYKIYSIKTDGTDRRKLTDDTTYDYINVADDRVYYINDTDGDKIYSIKTDGADRRKLNDDRTNCINVVGDRIYYINDTDGYKIYSIKTDGTNRQKLNDDGSLYINDGSLYIKVANDRIYYININDVGIYSIKTDGTERRKLNADYSENINVVDDRVYYSNSDDGNKIYSIKTDGTERRKLNADYSENINVVDDRIYYINRDDGNKIYSIKSR